MTDTRQDRIITRPEDTEKTINTTHDMRDIQTQNIPAGCRSYGFICTPDVLPREIEDDPGYSDWCLVEDEESGKWESAYYDFRRGLWLETAGEAGLDVTRWMYQPE